MAMRSPVGMPKLSRRARILIAVGAVLLLLLLSGSRLLSTYVDWLWFGEVGFRSVFTTVLFTRAVLFVAVGVLVGTVLALSLWLAYRSRPVFVPASGPDDPVARYRTAVTARIKLFAFGIPVLVGIVAGVAGQGNWQAVQLFLNGGEFGVTDPQFQRDIGFYAFQLPFFQWLLGWAFVAVAVAFVGALVAHYLFGGIRLAGRGGDLTGAAKVQLAVLAGVFVLLKAVAYYFDRFALLTSERNDNFVGATYTDLHAVMPAKLILLCIAVFCAAAFFVGAVRRNLQWPAIATALLVVSSVLLGSLWPAALEQFSVRPNANQREAPSIANNMEATRAAYGIDDINYIDYEGQSDLEPADLREDTATIPNVRLLDPNILTQTFTQLQQRRNFYGFPDKLDIDRYTIDGETQDYIVALREINTEGLAENQRNWINRHLVYTHGNGIVAAPANEVNSALADTGGEGGYPNFKVSDLATPDGFVPVENPRTYFGELGTAYAIVGTTDDQGNPYEYDTDNERYTYTGEGGVPIGNWFNRLVFAAYHAERNILFNQAISPDSKIIYNQNPRDRVADVAPWLTVDSDPYPAVVDGKITWIVDAYTTLDNYPYAEKTELGEATTDSLTNARGVPEQLDERISYIRNSVKATVDAYDGTVTLYAVDEEDPVLQAWQSVFPDTVQPESEISDDLRAHFRYPEDLFKVQRDLLTRYHVDNPSDFYANVGFWNVPSDPTVGDDPGEANTPQPPYYILAEDPATGEATFQLTSAQVFLQRQFLSGFMSVNSDPENYGDMTVLRLPVDSQTQGPQQVQTQFVSSTEVSTELNLLRQQATDVLFGNLLTLPVGGGLLYVEPVYIERRNEDSSFPQLAKVLVSFEGRVGYAPTLAEALDEVFGTGAGEGATDPTGEDVEVAEGDEPSGTDDTPTPPETEEQGAGEDTSTPTTPQAPPADSVDSAVQGMDSALERLQSAQRSGDFAEIGQAYQDLAEAIEQYESLRGDGG
ncbi:UPF0182 family protein [Actinoalloteichus caeruleus]|uniref:UPF0182 family protein n=1 Tax=Actinoalloteichus cyanogriseus TaxID=2893586 RepID=UPI003AAD5FE8